MTAMGDKEVFKPKPGQTDYTNARWAPVISCIVKHKDQILVVKRNSDMKIYPGWWNGIGGFLDDGKSLEEKTREELLEETGLRTEDIVSMKFGRIFDLEDAEIGKTWIIHPVLVEVKTDKITLDWEAEKYKWIGLDELDNFEFTPGFRKVVGDFFNP